MSTNIPSRRDATSCVFSMMIPPVALRATVLAALAALAIAAPANAVVYTFASGFNGDGFQWPPSPTGLLSDDYFLTPDGVQVYNFIDNNLYFDSNYQVAGNYSRITAEAMWGNPLDFGGGYLDMLHYNAPAQYIAFDFAWSVAGDPFATPEDVEIYVEDSEGRAMSVYWYLNDTFPGFGGFDGYGDRIELRVEDLYDDYFGVDGGPFIDIAWISITLYPIAGQGPASEFAIDNYAIDEEFTGDGEVFPSVNGGSIDVTGSGLGFSILRGTGDYLMGFEVTNGTLVDTTYTTELLPGTQITNADPAMGAFIPAGQTIYRPGSFALDRSLPSAEYTGQVNVINTGDASDPDNLVNLYPKLFEPPALTSPGPVDVTGGQVVTLSNAAAPMDGFRAAVEVTGSAAPEGFAVDGFAVESFVKPGENMQGSPAFIRYGLLSGSYSGEYAVSLEMTAFAGVNNDIEVYLAEAEPLSDVTWMLTADLDDHFTDGGSYLTGEPLGPNVVGVNTAVMAATIIDGHAPAAGGVSMTNLQTPDMGAATDVIGEAAVNDLQFGGAAPVYVLQFTYREQDMCAGMSEESLRLLHFDQNADDWVLAVDGNSDGGAGASFFAGPYADFAATLGGTPLSTVLGTHGLDAAGNQAWAIVDFSGRFGVGQVGSMCGNPADFDADGDVDLDDYAILSNCLTGPGAGIGGGCDICNLDDDGDVTLRDFSQFQRAFVR